MLGVLFVWKLLGLAYAVSLLAVRLELLSDAD